MYQGKRVVVIGAARSGVAAARFLAARGAQVTLSDAKRGEALASAREKLQGLPVAIEEGGNDPQTARAADLVIVSPGVPAQNPALQAAVAAGREVMGEVELASRHMEAPLLSITGSNGKSTTTVLTGEMLKASGQKTFVGGNLGTPLIEAAEGKYDTVVAEISSFQLEWVKNFRPKVAAFLNVSPNHLDRHASFEEYLGLKLRLFARQEESDISIFGADDEVLRGRLSAGEPERVTRGRRLSFSLSRPEAAARLSGRDLCLDIGQGEERYPLAELKLRGRHNWLNVLAALLLARSAGATVSGVRAALASFPGLPHRLETVGALAGVTYVNDSKATSVAAAVCALEAFEPETPLVLLAGGKDKGGSYAPLAPLIHTRCRAVILFGEARELIKEGIRDWGLGARGEGEGKEGNPGRGPRDASLPSGSESPPSPQPLASSPFLVADLGEAVRLARSLAQAGDVVLLAPACSSYDQFPHFEARGDTFRALVAGLV